DIAVLRRSEDAFVDGLFAPAAGRGAPLLRALFPRAFVDANREPYEIDPSMVEGRLPAYANTRSPRVAAGLGTVPRVAFDGQAIYHGKLRMAELERRIAWYYRPYHAALERLVAETRARFGYCILIDCHSMPSASPGGAQVPGSRVDFVLGDNHGAACAPALTALTERWLHHHGYRVVRNQPYAGGFTTQHYGAPSQAVHVLQIEINRALYMDERALRPTPGFELLAQRLADLVEDVGRTSLGHAAFPAWVAPRNAAE
ncbi:MAG TPA: N-formylglutamate amidohydrolase, partial [Vineibacter sp.]|nr:N-formylglutamate amidohydrolase [Vineibacter sp.]